MPDFPARIARIAPKIARNTNARLYKLTYACKIAFIDEKLSVRVRRVSMGCSDGLFYNHNPNHFKSVPQACLTANLYLQRPIFAKYVSIQSVKNFGRDILWMHISVVFQRLMKHHRY